MKRNSLFRALSLALSLCILCTLCIACTGKEAPAEDTASLAERQSLSLTGVGNARELGGYAAADGRSVKRGVLLRSARLCDATDEDAQRLTEDYHLGVIVDLRSADEMENAPDVQIEGVTYRNFDIFGDEATVPEGLLEELDELEARGVELDTVSMIRLYLKYGLYSDQFLVEIFSPPMPGRTVMRSCSESFWRCWKAKPCCFIAPRGRTAPAAPPCCCSLRWGWTRKRSWRTIFSPTSSTLS